MSFSLLLCIYIVILAAFTGYEMISRVPALLHTPLMSGTNFIHGIILIGAISILASAANTTERIIGFFAVFVATLNALGGYLVTVRMLKMFERDQHDKP